MTFTNIVPFTQKPTENQPYVAWDDKVVIWISTCDNAEFCNLHELEIKGIADGDVAKGIKSFKKGMASDVNDDSDPKNISDENQDSNKKE